MAQLVITGSDLRKGGLVLIPYVLVTWMNDTGGTTTQYRWGLTDMHLPDGSRVEGRAVSWDTLSLALSDASGVPQSTRFGVAVSDVDRFIASLIGQESTKWVQNQQMRVLLHTSASVLVGDTPITLMRGVIKDYTPARRRTAHFDVEDQLLASYASTDNEELPRRRISTTQFPDAPTGVIGLPEAIVYGKVSDGDAAPGPTKVISTSFARGKLDNPSFTRSTASDYDGDPVVLETSTAHGFITGQRVNISGHSIAEVNGSHICTAIDATKFSIPIETRTDGTGGSAYIQNALGLVPCLPVGTEVISSVVWNRFIVCGHAAKDVLQVYAGGELIAGVGYGGPAIVGVNLLAPIPGYTATEWPFATKYRDIGSRRYTLIYVKGERAAKALEGEATFTVNIEGIETTDGVVPTGTALGTQTLMTNMLDQYRHFMINFVIGDYQTGSWTTPQQFHIVVDTVDRVNSPSFDTAKTLVNARVAGGYVGAGVIGNNGELAMKAEWIARWNLSCDLRSFITLGGQFSVISPEAAAAAWAHTQTNDIVADSFDTLSDFSSMKNVVPYSYARNYRVNGWLAENATVYNTAAATAVRARLVDSMQEFWFVRTALVAENLAAFRLKRLKNGLRRATWSAGLHGIGVALGSTGTITHGDGPAAAGWVDRKVLVESMDIEITNGLVRLTALDLDHWDALITPYSTTPPHDSSSRSDSPRAAYGSAATSVTIVTSPGTGGSGTVATGTSISLGGNNDNPVNADTTFRAIPQAIPRKLGGTLGGNWTLNVAGFQLSAGTLEIELRDQTTAAQLAVVQLTTVAAALSGGFGYGSLSFAAPAGLDNVIAQYRVTVGTRKVVIGQITLTKD